MVSLMTLEPATIWAWALLFHEERFKVVGVLGIGRCLHVLLLGGVLVLAPSTLGVFPHGIAN